MDEKLQQDILALAQNLNDGHFTVLSRGIGLGVQRKKITIDKPLVIQEPTIEVSLHEQPVKIVPPLPSPPKEKVAVEKAKSNYKPSLVKSLIVHFFSLGMDFLIVLASVTSVFVGILYFAKPGIDLDLWMIQIVKDHVMLTRYARAASLVLLLAACSYVILFRLLVGMTVGQILLKRLAGGRRAREF